MKTIGILGLIAALLASASIASAQSRYHSRYASYGYGYGYGGDGGYYARDRAGGASYGGM